MVHGKRLLSAGESEHSLSRGKPTRALTLGAAPWPSLPPTSFQEREPCVGDTTPETQPGQEERVACGLLTPAKVTEPAAWLLGLQCYR